MSATPAPADPWSRYAGFEFLPVRVTVRVGSAVCSLGRLASLAPGDVVVLDRAVGDPFDLLVSGVLVARVDPVGSDDGVAVKVASAVEESHDAPR